MKKLTIVAKLKAQKGKESETRKALEALIPITLKEEGCLEYRLHVNTDNEGEFMFYENWTSHDLWQKHMNNTHLQDFVAKMDQFVDGDIDLSTWFEG
ncbi:antibiotic biosynthesis monooxygenase (plasmid) [Fulvitalea axinellae]|uniref:Antibiotic biosynthesis monooxygenase n=1 Tax=Fulvitalea axinellae TaxID=1182444 RepID=A0AAU9D0C8_9BACT|nr:antibiotic biosynthesis monooxygenase [Fulvitalea axinellae]